MDRRTNLLGLAGGILIGFLGSMVAAGLITGEGTTVYAQTAGAQKPNILFIFEQTVGIDQKTAISIGGALAAPITAFQYDWNMLPIGQQLWLKHLESYIKYPPLQAPESYNLSQVIAEVKKAQTASHAGE